MQTDTKELITQEAIKSKIYTIRGIRVMLDRDLAELYQVKTFRLNEQVKRNIKRFPERFMFQLTKKEKQEVIANCDNLDSIKFSPRLPNVFTEHGVSQISSVLNSNIAIDVSIQIIDAFVSMRKFLLSHNNIFSRLDNIEQKQIEYQLGADDKFNKVFKALESTEAEPKQGIFFDGQLFDAFKFILKLIKKAKTSIVLIDNYIDESVLTILDNRNSKVNALLITKNLDKKAKLMVKIHNKQYYSIDIKELDVFHDRFLIIDKKELYHIGASIKDLGKKCFGFSKVEDKDYLDSLLKKI